MKLPCLSVRASLTVLNPSRISETSAPASGVPRLSRTVPLMVASDLFEPAASASLVMKDTSAIRDKLKPNALLMRQRPPRPKSLLEAMDNRTGSGRRRTRNPQKQAVIVCHGANYCQVNGCFLLSALCAAERDLPATLGRARIQHPFHQTKNFRPFLGFRNK